MTTLPTASAPMNRWVIPGFITALVSLVSIPLSFVWRFGFGRLALQGHQSLMLWQLAMQGLALVSQALLVAALILSVTAVVQIKIRGTERGRGLALAAILITLGGPLLTHLAQTLFLCWELVKGW